MVDSFKKSQAGFTLLEVMIALTILATLSVLANQAIQQALISKVKLQTQIDDNSQIRDALKIVQRDINMAFHYRDLEKEIQLIVARGGQAQAQPPQPGVAVNPQAAVSTQQQLDQYNRNNPYRVDPTTNFVGNEKEMHFVTMSMDRAIENSQQADFNKVGYSLKSCRKPDQKGPAKSCLVRTQDPVVEGDVTKGGVDTLLIENVDEFKLRYLGKGKEDWVSDWNSVTGDSGVKNRYPDAVEVTITSSRGEGSKAKKISMQLVIPVHYPNNEADQASTSTTQGPQ